jgi:hypothetical protein
MLYQEKPLGRPPIVRRIVAALSAFLDRRAQRDSDLLSQNEHLRRDVGVQAMDVTIQRIDPVWPR